MQAGGKEAGVIESAALISALWLIYVGDSVTPQVMLTRVWLSG